MESIRVCFLPHCTNSTSSGATQANSREMLQICTRKCANVRFVGANVGLVWTTFLPQARSTVQNWAVLHTTTLQRLSANLRALRATEELSIEAAAEAADVDSRHWRKIEAGELSPTLETIAKICAAFDLTFGKLLDQEISVTTKSSSTDKKRPR